MINQFGNSLVRLCSALILGFSFVTSAALAEDGVTDSKIVIGISTPQSGSNSARPRKLTDGHKLYFDALNAAGGINGRKVELLIRDDEYEPQKTAENVRKLIHEDKVFAIFKIFGTPTLRAALPLIDKSGIPLFAPSSGDQGLRTTVRKNIFLVKAGFFAESELMVEAALNRDMKKLAIFYQDDGFGQDGRNGILKALSVRDLKPVAEAHYQRGATDINAAFETIEKANPEAILMWATPQQAIAFVQKAQAKKMKAFFFSNSTLVLQDYAATVKTGLQITGTPMPEATTLKIAKEYREAAQKAGQAIDASNFEGYIDAVALAAGLKAAGKNLTRKSFIDALEAMDGYDIGGLKLSFKKDHQGLEKPFLNEIKDGKFVPLD